MDAKWLSLSKKEKNYIAFNLYGQKNPEIMGDVEILQLIESMNEKDIVRMSCGFFHNATCTK